MIESYSGPQKGSLTSLDNTRTCAMNTHKNLITMTPMMRAAAVMGNLREWASAHVSGILRTSQRAYGTFQHVPRTHDDCSDNNTRFGCGEVATVMCG